MINNFKKIYCTNSKYDNYSLNNLEVIDWRICLLEEYEE